MKYFVFLLLPLSAYASLEEMLQDKVDRVSHQIIHFQDEHREENMHYWYLVGKYDAYTDALNQCKADLH